MRLLALTSDYSGHFKTVEYNSQGQNTVFVYSTFSSKVFLLPSKGKVNVYLSDEKGWSVSLLPEISCGYSVLKTRGMVAGNRPLCTQWRKLLLVDSSGCWRS